MNYKYQNFSCHDDYKTIIDYLDKNLVYPFKDKKVRLMIVNNTNDNLLSVFSEIFLHANIIKLNDLSLIFYVDDYFDLTDIIMSVSLDLGLNFKVNNGIYITKSLNNKTILEYISFVNNYFKITTEVVSDLVSMLQNNVKDYQEYFKINILPLIIKDTLTKDLVLVYFNNDLNVLKTSKKLYMNRNSLINKLDLIYKSTGVNLQKFSHAATIYMLLLADRTRYEDN